MNNLVQVKDKKFIKVYATNAICCLVISVLGCTTPPPPKEHMSAYMQETVATPEQEYKPAPIINSIIQSPAANGTRTITLKGSGFDNGAAVEIYTTSGKYIGSGILSGKPHSNQLTVKLMKGLEPGKYTVKVKSPDGRFSNTSTLTIPKTSKPPPPQCVGHFSKEPKVIYLGGGDAVKLFERYLGKNSEIKTDTGNFDIKIKFYEKEKAADSISLQTVWLNDELKDYLRKQMIESWEDFIKIIKKRLKGRVAEPSGTLADDAARENADYFQCP